MNGHLRLILGVNASELIRRVTFFFDPAVDRGLGKRHAFGQLISAHRIAQLANRRPKLLALHQAQLTTVLSSVNPGGDPSALAIDHNNEASLGVSALLLRLLLATSDQVYDARAHSQSLADHLIEAWDESEGFPEYLNGKPTKSAYLQRYYTGIAALALVEHFDTTQNEKSLQVALAAINWLEEREPCERQKSFSSESNPGSLRRLARLTAFNHSGNFKTASLI